LGITWSNFVPIVSENEQPVAELLKI